jgi:hypothetical protein
MKIMALSDFHGSIEASGKAALNAKLIGADIFLVCGDITTFGSVEEAEKVLSPLIALKLPLLFVPGNCDPPELEKAEIKGAVCIHGRCENYGNATFLGLGSTLISQHRTPFELIEKEIMQILNQGLQNCLLKRWFILVSHSPPKNTKVDLAFNRDHMGSVTLRKFIEDKKPQIVFCGHVHEAMGIDYIGDTIIVNPGPARHRNCAVADLNEKIEVQLSQCE